MKALKEKRISLRSLWRMGLVVLSVFALAFVSCAQSTGEPGPGPGPSTPGSTGGPVPLGTMTIVDLPLSAKSAAVEEGMKIPVEGWVFNVRYGDGTQKTVTADPSNTSVTPGVFIYTPDGTTDANGKFTPKKKSTKSVTEYTVAYTEQGRTATATVEFPRTRRILDLNPADRGYKKSYRIDDFPELEGLILTAWYSPSDEDNDAERTYPDDANNSFLTQSYKTQHNWYFKDLPIADYRDFPNEYKWAWVENKSPAGASFEANDNPGVLLSIGSYGRIESTITGNYGGEDRSTEVDSYLFGTRIPIDRLYHVKKVSYSGEPKAVFFDDPTLISGIYQEKMSFNEVRKAFDQRIQDWIARVFSDVSLVVEYDDGGSPYTFPVPELQHYNRLFAGYYGGFLTPYNYGLGGTWANFDIFPVSWVNATTGYKIDVTRNTKPMPDRLGQNWDYDADGEEDVYGDNDPNQTLTDIKVMDFDWVMFAKTVTDGEHVYFGAPGATAFGKLPDYVEKAIDNLGFEPEDYYHEYATNLVRYEGTDKSWINGDGGWAQWAAGNYGRTRFKFTWRNRSTFVPVPVWNRPVSGTLVTTPKSGYAIDANTVEMSGFDQVYRRPQGMADYISKLDILVTYNQNGAPRQSEPVSLEERRNLGQIWDAIYFATSDTGESLKLPLLYSTTIFNFNDIDGYPKEGEWPTASPHPEGPKDGGDLYVQRSRIIFQNPVEEGTPTGGFLGAQRKFVDNHGYGQTGNDMYGSIKDAITRDSLLTLDNSNAYVNRAKAVRGRVNFTTWAGDPFTTRTVNSNTMLVGPVGYQTNPKEETAQ